MNNVKRIIAAGLVGTAVISTGVVASAEEVTYKEAAIKALTDAGVPAQYAADVADACGKIVLTDAQAKTVNDKIAYALNAIDGKSKEELAAKDSPVVKDLQANVQKPLERQLNISIVADQGTGLAISKVNPETGETLSGADNELLSWSIDDLKAINAVANKKKLQDSSTIATVMEYAKQTDKNAVKPGTSENQGKDPATTTPGEEDPTYDDNKSEETAKQIAAVEALKANPNWTDAQKADFEKAKESILKMLKNGYVLSELQAAKALVATLPDGPEKDALLAAIAHLETFTNENGQTGGEAVLEATKTPTADANSNTTGTTTKTATNFGNVAVAGLGLMTVAGAVFVISKKKIC